MLEGYEEKYNHEAAEVKKDDHQTQRMRQGIVV